MTSPLERLASQHNAPLKAEPPDAREFAGLLKAGVTRLADAGNLTVSLEGRFDHAYGAAHSLSLAAVRFHGFRPTKRYIVFQVLPHTLGLDAPVWAVLSKAHDVRNLGDYEGDLQVTERLVSDIIVAAGMVLEKLRALPPLE